MPLRTIRNEDDATFAYSSGWTLLGASGIWGSTPTSPAASGTVKFSSTAGSTCTITLPANHTFTGGVIIGHGAATNNPNASITVDGVTVQAVWNQKIATVGDAHLYLARMLSYPFVLNPAKGTTQVIVITVGNGGGNLIIDGMELYQAAAPVAGRVVRFGMSMEYPVIDSNTLGPNTAGHGQLFVAYLNQIAYLGLTSWVDVNQAVPSEALTEGSANSGLAGGPNGAGAYPQFTNQTFYENTAILTPGWMRAEAGDLWPNTGGHAPRLGTGLFTTDAQYMAGVAQWWAQLFNYGIFFHNFNDTGYSGLLDNPADDVVLNGASALKTIATVTVATGTPNSGTFTITDGTHPTVMGPLSTLATLQANCTSSGLPVTLTSNVAAGSSQLAAVGNQVTFTANTRGTLALSKSADSVGGGTVTFATTQVGRPKIAAGAGFALTRFIQRVRESMIRVALAITPCPNVLYIGMPNSANGGIVYDGYYPIYDQAMRDLMVEPWIPALTGRYPFKFVSIMGPMTGHPSNVSTYPTYDPHPNTVGHYDIFLQLVAAHDAMTSVAPSSSFH